MFLMRSYHHNIIATQYTYNEFLKLVPKYRITHDLSIEKSLGNSFNKRLIREELPDTTCVFCLLRFLHQIHTLRLAKPKKIITMSKIDAKSAYR